MTSGSASSSSRWIKIISTQGNIRGVAIQATDLARETAELHQLKGIYARACGEALMGAALIGSFCKPGERANLNIQGTGHFQQALFDAHPDGAVRGYVIPRSPELAVVTEEQGPWGKGLLSVLRTKGGEGKQPYIGTVPLLTGHLAKDLTLYWAQSEQIPSAVGLAVNMRGDEISSAGGFLVQALPGASPVEIQTIERHISEIHSLAESVATNADPLSLLSQIFQSTAFVLLEERPLRFECNCSWERVERALALVGAAELQAMLTQDNKASVHCDFCTKVYEVDAERLRKLIHASDDGTKK